MDSTGWHARHRAERDSARLGQPQRGPDGRYQPVEQIYPLEPPFVGGFTPPGAPSPTSHNALPPLPPRPPPKDDDIHPGRLDGSVPDPARGTWIPPRKDAGVGYEPARYSVSDMAHMSAAERARSYKVAYMEPHLQLMAGPLLRYDTVDEQGIWLGAALIVTADSGSNYEQNPRFTYYWDPDQPVKLARRPSTTSHRGPSVDLGPHPADPMSGPSHANREPLGPNAIVKEAKGQDIYVYIGVSGTYTFWRFMVQIPLGPNEMRIRYRVNGGQDLQFYVPARHQNMRWAAYSCNGFSAGVNPNDFCGPGFRSGYDPVWIDLLEKHAEQPFHALVGGGDQLYCDGVVREPELQEWVTMSKSDKKRTYPMTDEILAAIDRFYFNHYCQTFRSGAFARANSSIPMINMLDDHDLIDGFGSYPDELMISPVFRTCAPLDSHEYSARLLMISAALDHEDISSFFFFNVSLIWALTGGMTSTIHSNRSSSAQMGHLSHFPLIRS